jgi:DTW domain-containing protein YfiP
MSLCQNHESAAATAGEASEQRFRAAQQTRCAVCRYPRFVCVCGLSPRVTTATRVVVMLHAREAPRFSNTGRFAPLALTNAEVRVHGRERVAAPVQGIDWTSPSTLVLYPGARPLTAELARALPGPATLVVPDGNWGQARHMMRRIPELGRARAVSLPGPFAEARRMRKNHDEDRMSTFEAIVLALSALEGEAVAAPLFDFYRRAADRMLMLRGKISGAEVYGGIDGPETFRG